MFYYEEIQSPVSSIIDTITLQNAIFDEVIISDNLDFDTEQPTDYFPDEWSEDIKLHAQFQNNIVAGGVAYDFRNQNNEDCGFLIKRRPTTEIMWTTIGYANSSNFTITDGVLNGFFIDRTAIPNNDYEYMIIPILFGEEYPSSIMEGSVHCWTDGISISDKDTTYYTILEPKISNIVQNDGSVVVKPLNGRYPYSFKNGEINYISGNASGLFAPTKDDCEHIFDNENTNNMVWKYRKTFREWLCNGKPKIQKYYDGRTYLISVTGTVNDDDSEHRDKNITSWNWSETGDVENTNDLKENGLIDKY